MQRARAMQQKGQEACSEAPHLVELSGRLGCPSERDRAAAILTMAVLCSTSPAVEELDVVYMWPHWLLHIVVLTVQHHRRELKSSQQAQ